MKNKKLIIIIGITVLLLAGILVYFIFFNNEEENKTNPEDKNTPINEEAEEVTIVDIDSTSRPYAIMINNLSDARPYHTGLQDAYILYEIVVESGITRFLALYKDAETAMIHGVRSARSYYIDYALENDAIYIHWGKSSEAQGDLYLVDSYEVGAGSGAYRDESLPVSTEHTTYTSIGLIDEEVEGKFREETNKDLLLNYVANPLEMTSLENSKEATNIDITYSSSFVSNFEYNTETKTYYWNINDKAHTDDQTNEHYNFKNIITYQLSYSKKSDSEESQSLHNIGSGTGYYISEGYAVPIIWEKDTREGQTIYMYEDGTEIDVNDGNTYIGLQPEGNSLKIN